MKVLKGPGLGFRACGKKSAYDQAIFLSSLILIAIDNTSVS